MRGPSPTPRAGPRHPTPPRASGSSESSPSRLPSPGCTNRPRGPKLPNLRPGNPWRSLPRPKWSMRLNPGRMIHDPHPTSSQENRLPYGNLLGILRLHAKARRRETPEPNPLPDSGPASPIPRSGGRSGTLVPIRSGRAARACATTSIGDDHDTPRPTHGRSTHGRLGMRADGSGASPQAASTSPGSAYAPVVDASTPRTAGSACLAGSDGNTSAPSRPQLKSRTSNAGGASWNATGQSVNGGTRNAIRKRTPSPILAMAIDMRSERDERSRS